MVRIKSLLDPVGLSARGLQPPNNQPADLRFDQQPASLVADTNVGMLDAIYIISTLPPY